MAARTRWPVGHLVGVLEAAKIVEGRQLPYLQLSVSIMSPLFSRVQVPILCARSSPARISFMRGGREMSGMPAGGRWLVLARQTVAATT
ncbi:hypothetical protein EEB14_35205 [Rhodococcus sp. WS4]|nr:hypothetical protein EEB14_35205 [Rhodococcus sp. WS4]